MTVATRPEPRRGSPGCGGLLDYEARLIARTVSSYGALERTRVYQLTDASKWRAASFDRACELAVRRGLVRDLGLGFYAAPDRTQAPENPHGGKEDGAWSVALLLLGGLLVLTIVLLIALAASGETFALILAFALMLVGLVACCAIVSRAGRHG